jgi:uncharacterized protein YjdB
MKDYTNYRSYTNVDMVDFSGNFHFNEQLKQEGTDIKINNESTQLIDDIETPIRAIIRNHGNEYSELKEERSIMIDKKYNYKAGDYIVYLDDTYLTNNSIDKDNPFFNTAKMTRCNYILKWMDDEGLHEQPCMVINNTKYTGGIKNLTSGITEVDAMVNITIQNNENTNKIGYGKRLYTMKNAWQVTLIDDITTENTLSWTLGKDSLSTEVDDIINGICDAYANQYTITLNSTSQTLSVGGTYQITASVSNNNKPVSNPNINWTSSDNTIATVNNGLVTAITSGNCIISCNIGSVQAELSLVVVENTSTEPVISYGYDFSQTTIIKEFVTSILTCTKTIDAVSSPLNISYNFDSLGQSLISSGKITVTTKSSSSIAIKNVSVSTNTVIHITVLDSIDNTKILDNIEITLTGM